jgi:hypothetical protein
MMKEMQMLKEEKRNERNHANKMLREIKEEQGREPGTKCLCNMKTMHWQH